MRFVCVIATHGEMRWHELATVRALPTAQLAGFAAVVQVHELNGTVATARNEGARLATLDKQADYLVFLDADDELEVGYALRLQWEAEKHPPDSKLLLTPAVTYTRGRIRPIPKLWPRLPIEDGNWMVIGTAIPASVFAEVGGFREWPMYEDWCLWQRAIKAGCEPVDVPDAVYVAHASPNSRNRKPTRRAKLEAHDAIRRANFPELYDRDV